MCKCVNHVPPVTTMRIFKRFLSKFTSPFCSGKQGRSMRKTWLLASMVLFLVSGCNGKLLEKCNTYQSITECPPRNNQTRICGYSGTQPQLKGEIPGVQKVCVFDTLQKGQSCGHETQCRSQQCIDKGDGAGPVCD